jgi:hypothetical protein
MIFTIYFNEPYLKWAELLSESILLNHNDAFINAYAINLPVNKLEKFYNYPNKISVLRNTIEPIKGAEMSWQIIAHKASFLLNSIVMNTYQLHVLLDADMMLIKPIPDELQHRMMKNDLGGLLINPLKIAGGIIIANPTTLAIDFLRDWEIYLLDGKYFFNKDQPKLAELHAKYIPKKLRWLQLDRSYMDHHENSTSIIWSAHKSELGTKDIRFKKYEKKLNDIKRGYEPIFGTHITELVETVKEYFRKDDE